jgi:hypothetical protein
VAGLTAGCGNGTPTSTSAVSTQVLSFSDTQLARGLTDGPVVSAALGDPSMSVSAPPPFRLAEIRDTYVTCENGLHGAFSWLVSTQQLVGSEISTDAQQPTKLKSVLTVLAAAPSDLPTDPLSAIVRGMEQCGAMAKKANITVQGKPMSAVRMLAGINNNLTGHIVTEEIRGYIVIATAAHIGTDPDTGLSDVESTVIAAALTKAHAVLEQ